MTILASVPPLPISNVLKQTAIDTHYLKHYVTMNRCEFCDKEMTEEDHNFCDICGECREENEDE